MTFYYSPLRYPGGKTQLVPYLRHFIELNDLEGRHYVEPFAGGASVALDLLFREYVSEITINDKDLSIFSFWRSVLNYTEELCKLISDTSISIDVWKEQKEIHKNSESASELELGFATFFLNRCNRSGILNAGAIGGQNQTGNWKIDARFNKIELIKRISKIAQYSNRINIHNLDACELVDKLLTNSDKKFFYFDPPYYVKGQDLYLNYFKHEDHVRIRDRVSHIQDTWLMTYDNHEEIKKLYSNYRSRTYDLNYSAGTAAKGTEIMIYSNDVVKLQ
jgi:DNA adenine methylase